MKKRGQKGFSLMELLIAVGVLGTLTAISVPSYKKYARHSKTAEAQSSLGQIYMAEKAFHLQWKFYTGDLLVIGVQPQGRMLYNAGFSATDTSSAYVKSPQYQGTTIILGQDSFSAICGQEFGNGAIETCAFNYIKAGNETPFTAPIIEPSYTYGDPAKTINTTATEDAFKAVAIGDIINRKPGDPDNPVPLDTWSIDNYKRVVRIEDGTAP